jgi:DNA-binding IclR family transcriptional regulator
MTWKPDRRSVEWAIGVLHEDRIVDSLRQEVQRRMDETDDYWHLVASIAVEHIAFDLGRQLELWESDERGGSQ